MEDNHAESPLAPVSPLSEGNDANPNDSPFYDEWAANPDEIITDETLIQRIVGPIKEYFCSRDTEGFVKAISYLVRMCENHSLELTPTVEIVKHLVITGIDFGEIECELASRGLSAATGAVLSTMSVIKGFEKVIDRCRVIDHPNAFDYISRFLARGVADDIIPPSFLNDLKGNGALKQTPEYLADRQRILNAAKGLLVGTCVSQRMERIWGTAAVDDLVDLKLQISLILKEYFLNPSIQDCADSLKRLRNPYFLHEFVKRGLIMGMEQKQKGTEQILDLLCGLAEGNCIPVSQFVLGLQRIHQEIKDSALDIPSVNTLMDIVHTTLVQKKVISQVDLQKVLAL